VLARVVRGRIAAVIALGLLFWAASAGAAYHPLKKVNLGGEGGWDLLTVDAEARRLYIPRSSHILVVDADSCRLVGDILNTPGVHGVAIAHELGRGFSSNGADSSATIFDLKDLKELGKVRTGSRPDAIVYDPASRRVFTMNAGSRDLTAIDAARGEAVGTVALGGRPELAAVDAKGRLFVNLEDSSAVAVVDTRSLKVISRWPLAPGLEPTGLALDRDHQLLFAVCGNQLMVVLSAVDGHVVTTLPIGTGVDGAAFDPETGLAFSSNGEGSLTVVKEEAPDRLKVLETVPTQAGARTLALDEKTHRVFLVTAEFGAAPEPTAEHPHPRRPAIPGSFVLLVMGDQAP
jgi:DNA-binding beta-propeller fold protein YncE